MKAPDDADLPAEVGDAERAGRPARLQLRGRARGERASVLENADARDALVAPIRDLPEAVRELEAAREGDGDVLLDQDAAVRRDLCTNVGLDEVVRLAERGRGECKRDQRRGGNCQQPAGVARRLGRKDGAFKDFRATGIRASGYGSCAY
ncbi:MAG: hypothetical protein WD380_01025 [Gaiellaceae bacterium]